jgi:UDP-N-acetylglucosamine acyltransferase
MSVHPTAIIEAGVELGAGCEVQAYAIIRQHSILGEGVVVHPFAVIGGDPQFLKFDPATVSGVRIGAGTIVREHCTVNRSIHAGKHTRVGARCFLMANAHVGHDSAVGDDVVLGNNVLLAGHVEVACHTFLGGAVGVHQFCRIGEGVIAGGMACITQDVAPFLMVAERNRVPGLNSVGLKRRGFSREAIKEIKECFSRVFSGGNPREHAAALLAAGAAAPEARRFLEFFTGGKRGFVRPDRTGLVVGEGDHE